jgi:DNA-binding PadR family transcriptional regulator
MRLARSERTLTEWVVLALVDEQPTHGWAIVRALRPDGPIGGVWTSTGPLVYRAIHLLEQGGLLRSSGSAAGQGPSRTVLEITPEGSEAVEAWLMEPVAHVRDLRSELLVKLLLLERRGLDPALLVRRQRERLRPVARGLRRQARTVRGTDRLVPLWRATAVGAALRFLSAVEAGSDDRRTPPADGAETEPVDTPEPAEGKEPPT